MAEFASINRLTGQQGGCKCFTSIFQRSKRSNYSINAEQTLAFRSTFTPPITIAIVLLAIPIIYLTLMYLALKSNPEGCFMPLGAKTMVALFI